MKKIILTIVLVGLFGMAGFNFVVSADVVAEKSAEIVVPRQYIALGRMLSDSQADIDKAVEIASKAVRSVVAKGETYEDKLGLLSEISSALMAAISDWSPAKKAAVVRAIVVEALTIAPDGDEGNTARIGYLKQVFAAIRYASNDSVSLIAALEVVPENLKAVANYAIENAMTILGGTNAWKCKDLYDAVQVALSESRGRKVNPRLSDAMVVTVSTTTTTTTSTTTTTTTIPGAAGLGVTTTTQPSPIPTTKPSPTPVGLR